MQVTFPRKICKEPLYYPQTHKELWCQQVTPEVTKAYTMLSIQLWRIPKFAGLERKVCTRLSKPVTFRRHQSSRYCKWTVRQSANQSISWRKVDMVLYDVLEIYFLAIKWLKYQVTGHVPTCKCNVQQFMGLPNEIIVSWFTEFLKIIHILNARNQRLLSSGWDAVQPHKNIPTSRSKLLPPPSV